MINEDQKIMVNPNLPMQQQLKLITGIGEKISTEIVDEWSLLIRPFLFY